MNTKGVTKRVFQQRFEVGSPLHKVDDALLPPIPDELRAWVTRPVSPGVYIHGPGIGKTYLGLWAGREMINLWGIDGMYRWTVRRFGQDTETNDWYKKALIRASSDDALWHEGLEYEKNFLTVTQWPLLMFDDLYYFNSKPWITDDIWGIIKERCEEDLRTIVVARNLPAPDSTPMELTDKYLYKIEIR